VTDDSGRGRKSVTFTRNERSRSTGTAGHVQAESVVTPARNTQTGHGQHRKYLSYAFTEQGVAMLSSVLNSKHAIAINIEIMRAFVKLRDLLSSNREFARRFAQLETRLDKKLTEHDEAIAAILSAIRQLMGKSSTH
jgi:phage regulator Rha-like protein